MHNKCLLNKERTPRLRPSSLYLFPSALLLKLQLLGLYKANYTKKQVASKGLYMPLCSQRTLSFSDKQNTSV